MAPGRSTFDRNVRPAREIVDGYNEDLSELEDDGADFENGDEPNEEFEVEEAESGDAEDEADGGFEQQITTVSFGALKQAHDALSRKRKRGFVDETGEDDKLGALRRRLRQIKEEKGAPSSSQERKNASRGSKSARRRESARSNDERDDEDEIGDESDSDSAPSEEGAPTKNRTSKHAPTAQSTRHQVTRKRTVVAVPRTHARDPRFDALHASSHPGANTDKAYSFLRSYQEAEIAELKAALKAKSTTLSEDDKITLRRKINSMENRLKAKDAKDKEQEVVRKFRREEREKVEQGKTPFYLKKKDVKERALVERFKGMKGKEREKAVERRKVRESQKEMKRMPNVRRQTG